jgi:hypothetical protein
LGRQTPVDEGQNPQHRHDKDKKTTTARQNPTSHLHRTTTFPSMWGDFAKSPHIQTNLTYPNNKG